MTQSTEASVSENTRGSFAPAHHDVMLISEIASEAEMDPKTIRFYERAQLINPQKHGRIRIYREHDLDRLLAIKKLRQYGVPLAVMRSLIKQEGGLSLKILESPTAQRILADQLDQMNRKKQFMQEQILDLEGRLQKITVAPASSQ